MGSKKRKGSGEEVKPQKENAAVGDAVEEGEDRKQRRKILHDEPRGLEIYWKLSSVNRDEREVAAMALARELQAAQQEFESRGKKVENDVESILLAEANDEMFRGCSPDLQYALPRLVRGVASSNLCARQGFALALTTIAAVEPSITSDLLITLIDKEIEVTQSMKAQELKDGLLGKLFGYAAIVRAGRLIDDANTKGQQDSVKRLVEELLKLARKKAFLRGAVTCTVLELVDRLSPPSLQKSVFAVTSFENWLQSGPEAGGADVLLLALKVWKKMPESLRASCALLPKSGSESDLFQVTHLEVIIPYLKESSSSHPKVHPVWHAIADIFSDETLFVSSAKKSKRKSEPEEGPLFNHCLVTFWDTVVDGNLLVSSHERKHLAMQVVILFLAKLPSSCIPIVISNAFGRCLLDILSAEKNLLYSSAKQFLSDLCTWAAQDQGRLVPVIASLQQSSCGKFDQLTKTSTIRTLVSGVTNTESCLSAIQNVRDMFLNDPSSSPDDSEETKKATDRRKIWMLDLLYGLCRLTAASKSASREVLVFLMAHILTCSVIVRPGKLKKLLKWTPRSNSKAVEDACKSKLRSLLADRSLLRVRSKPIAEHDQVEDLGSYLVEFFQRAIKPVEDEPHVQETLYSTITQLSSAIWQEQKADQKDVSKLLKLKAMRCLLGQLVIESWLQPGSIDDIATELLICCKKAFGKAVDIPLDAEDSKTAPPVVDVVVDVILSLLSQSSAPVRNAAEQLFSVFAADITPSGISNMLKIVMKQIAPRSNKMFRMHDADESDEDDDIVAVEDDSEDDKSEILSEDDESGLETEPGKDRGSEEDIQVAMDDTEGSDLDDEAMFRIDSHLSQILKQRKKGGSNDPSEQLVQFKFRVLALLENFASNQSTNPLLLVAVPTLFQAHLDAKVGANGGLADKTLSIMNKVFKAKQHPKGSVADMASLKALLDKMIKVLTAKDKQIRGVAEAFSIWLIKVAMAVPDGGAVKEIGEFMSTVLDIAFAKSSRLGPGFVRDGLTRFPSLGKLLTPKLLEKCKTAPTDRLKAEAMILMGIILKHYGSSKSSVSTCSDEAFAWSLKPYLPLLSEVMVIYLSMPHSKGWAEQKNFARIPVEWVEAVQLIFSGRPLRKLLDIEAISKALVSFKSCAKGKAKVTAEKLESLLRATNESEGKSEAEEAKPEYTQAKEEKVGTAKESKTLKRKQGTISKDEEKTPKQDSTTKGKAKAKLENTPKPEKRGKDLTIEDEPEKTPKTKKQKQDSTTDQNRKKQDLVTGDKPQEHRKATPKKQKQELTTEDKPEAEVEKTPKRKKQESRKDEETKQEKSARKKQQKV